jgi:hypothetical protein
MAPTRRTWLSVPTQIWINLHPSGPPVRLVYHASNLDSGIGRPMYRYRQVETTKHSRLPWHARRSLHHLLWTMSTKDIHILRGSEKTLGTISIFLLTYRAMKQEVQKHDKTSETENDKNPGGRQSVQKIPQFPITQPMYAQLYTLLPVRQSISRIVQPNCNVPPHAPPCRKGRLALFDGKFCDMASNCKSTEIEVHYQSATPTLERPDYHPCLYPDWSLS